MLAEVCLLFVVFFSVAVVEEKDSFACYIPSVIPVKSTLSLSAVLIRISRPPLFKSKAGLGLMRFHRKEQWA